MTAPDVSYHHLMTGGFSRAGFVLVGGMSSRMGRDKALLPLNGSTLAGEVAARVLDAAGNVTLIGSPDRYRSLGFPLAADRITGCGPLGGVYTALSLTQANWNLIVACDLPDLPPELLHRLLLAAEASPADCVVPKTSRGLEPLCAVYHRRCRDAAQASIARKVFKMHDFVSSLRSEMIAVSDPSVLINANTPEDWGSR